MVVRRATKSWYSTSPDLSSIRRRAPLSRGAPRTSGTGSGVMNGYEANGAVRYNPSPTDRICCRSLMAPESITSSFLFVVADRAAA
jgi:hypothetical protein